MIAATHCVFRWHLPRIDADRMADYGPVAKESKRVRAPAAEIAQAASASGIDDARDGRGCDQSGRVVGSGGAIG